MGKCFGEINHALRIQKGVWQAITESVRSLNTGELKEKGMFLFDTWSRVRVKNVYVYDFAGI